VWTPYFDANSRELKPFLVDDVVFGRDIVAKIQASVTTVHMLDDLHFSVIRQLVQTAETLLDLLRK
jgi:hypothetical protein